MANGSFIVTYTRPVVEPDDAAKILSVAKAKVKDSVEALIAETVPAEDETLHFRDIGASVCMMSEANAEKLRQHEDVAEVVPDFEVFALGDTGDTPECQFGSNSDEWAEDAHTEAYFRALQGYASYGNMGGTFFTPFPPMDPLPPQPWPFPPFPPSPRPPFP